MNRTLPEKTFETSAEAVFEKYNLMVYRLAFARTRSSFDADDILGEVFLRYVRSAPLLESEEHLRAWLIRVTLNCTSNHFSSSWNKKTVPLDDNLAVNMKEKSEVYYALLELPDKYRTVVHLYYYEGLSVKEIASLSGETETGVKTRLWRARKLLKEKLESVEL